MEEKVRDIDSFEKAIDGMVSKNEEFYNNNSYFGFSRYERKRDYSEKEIEKIIERGTSLERINLSRYYYSRKGIYQRIIIHYATILRYYGILIPVTPNSDLSKNETNLKKYNKALDYIESLSLPNLFTKIATSVLVDGVYYGLIQSQSKRELVILDLPSEYCISQSKNYLGNDIVQFNINFFSKMTAEAREKAFLVYPPYFKTYYEDYAEGKTKSPYLKLPTDATLYYTFSNDKIPPFLNTIISIIGYNDSVDNERERQADEIRKIITQHIPHLADGTLLFQPDEALQMHTGAVGMLKGNKNISVLTTYADADSIVSKTSNEAKNNYVASMLKAIYAEAAASPELFSPSSAQSVKNSVLNDINFMMILANQFSDFITRVLNFNFGNTYISFKYMILPISLYNQSDYITDALKLAQSGYSFIVPSIALGISQRDLVSLKDLENNVLKLQEKLIPLSSSYTQSAAEAPEAEEAGPGAPEKDLEDKAPKTIQNEDSAGGSDK